MVIYKVMQNKITGSYYICRWCRTIEIMKTPTKPARDFMATATRTEEPMYTVWYKPWDEVKKEVISSGPKR